MREGSRSLHKGGVGPWRLHTYSRMRRVWVCHSKYRAILPKIINSRKYARRKPPIRLIALGAMKRRSISDIIKTQTKPGQVPNRRRRPPEAPRLICGKLTLLQLGSLSGSCRLVGCQASAWPFDAHVIAVLSHQLGRVLRNDFSIPETGMASQIFQASYKLFYQLDITVSFLDQVPAESKVRCSANAGQSEPRGANGMGLGKSRWWVGRGS